MILSAFWVILKFWPNNYSGILDLCATLRRSSCVCVCAYGESLSSSVRKKRNVIPESYLKHFSISMKSLEI